MRRILFAAFVVLAAQFPAQAQERILNFVSDVTVQTNGDLDVTETITVQAQGQQIRRGIFRDFPTRYTNRQGIRVIVGFDVVSVTRDGQPERFTTENISNGVRTRIGNADVLLRPGRYTYVIRYRTTRQVGFFDNFDELYWNATGNGWNFIIDSAEARITLPQGAKISQNASYTGPQGARGTNARVVEQTDNRIVWRTTQRLGNYEGLTVAAGWQKGIIAPPSAAQRASYFFQDNLPLLAALIGLVGAGLYYFSTWSRVGRDPESGTIIPLFGPPNNMSPAAVRYLDQLGFDNRAFTAAIVDLGVKGHLKLVETPGWSQVEPRSGGKTLDGPEHAMRAHLFGNSNDAVLLKQSNHVLIGGAKSVLENELARNYNGKMFTNNYGWSILGFLLVLVVIGTLVFAIATTRGGDEAAAGLVGMLVGSGLILFASFFIMAGFTSHSRFNWWFIGGGLAWLIIALGAMAFIVGFGGGFNLNLMIPALLAYVLTSLGVFGFYWFKAPSREGQQVRDQISGFREYLSVAEEDRLNVMNPPKKTPELFEKFLPYAIALDCENEWGKKFAAILAAAAAAGAVYTWYNGQRDWSRDPAGFSNHIGSTVAAAISSASTAPGSSSGSSGGGSSGGGGGGGGGGGW
jgi:uncharacterized membrane protein YgcG